MLRADVTSLNGMGVIEVQFSMSPMANQQDGACDTLASAQLAVGKPSRSIEGILP